ncbi:hypothetical protein LX32DRAFT_651091 [Colletotrichum zoysiae]|uniref:Uncharacterized protein n=1 Tax=Colletotrichum zoysiae TaxID=1216348 RepID=A0AAD9M758_9PEZI|nr:hypothetical protein LX32DRAFT_651091 [Colletotrichum zoysiae]
MGKGMSARAVAGRGVHRRLAAQMRESDRRDQHGAWIVAVPLQWVMRFVFWELLESGRSGRGPLERPSCRVGVKPTSLSCRTRAAKVCQEEPAQTESQLVGWPPFPYEATRTRRRSRTVENEGSHSEETDLVMVTGEVLAADGVERKVPGCGMPWPPGVAPPGGTRCQTMALALSVNVLALREASCRRYLDNSKTIDTLLKLLNNTLSI